MTPVRRASTATLLIAGATVLASCRQPETEARSPETARPDIVEALRADLAAERHPSDGGGSVRLLESTPVRAGEPGRWLLEYAVGPEGIAEGGAIYFQVSPFWGWSTPQVDSPRLPGFTQVTTTPEGLAIEARTVDSQLLMITAGEPLTAGHKVLIDYGAGFLAEDDASPGAFADTFRDREARLWIGVDGDGDGVRAWLDDSPMVDIAAGSPTQWVAHLPGTATAGDEVRLRVGTLDALGSLSEWTGAAELTLPAGLDGPASLQVDDGYGEVPLSVLEDGLYRLTVGGGDLESATSNPLLASASFPRLLWGDLHGHTGLSDGTGTPEDYFAYAREVAGLDFAAITDHDHWGIQPLDRSPANWDRIRASVGAAHRPPVFVALLGYEWTNWIYGHRHVVHFTDDGPLVSSIEPETDHPEELWDALAGSPSLTFAHHSSGDPIPTDWSIAPDPLLEPVTEVVSVHGSSEAADARRPVTGSRPGQHVRDALGRGYELGFIGSGDSHDGHPGLTHLASTSGGLAAVFAAENSRQAILEALRARRTYATDGPRMLLRVTLDGAEMGSAVEPGSESKLHAFTVGTEPITQIAIIADGEIVAEHVPEAGTLTAWDTNIDTRAFDYLYVRVRQAGFGTALSSPFYFD